PPPLSVLQGAVRPARCRRGGRRRGAAPGQGRERGRGSLLPVQALLQPLSVHPSPPLAGGLPAADAALAIRGSAGQGSDPPGPLPRQYGAGGEAGEHDRAILQLGLLASPTTRAHAGCGGYTQGSPATALPPGDLLRLV